MAVYKRGYAAYTGEHTATSRRFLVLTRYGWSELFASRIFTTFYVTLVFVPFLVCAIYIYVCNSAAVQQLLGMGNSNMRGVLQIDRMFFLGFLQFQGWWSLLLAAWVGPSLVSPDLTNGALPLFLSRPLSRTYYVIGKSLVLLVLIGMISLVPALLLFALQASLGPSGWAGQNISLVPAIIACTLLWGMFLCALSLALSAWVRWRVVATGLTFAIFFLPAGFGVIMNLILRTWWGNMLNFWQLMVIVWHHLFGVADRLNVIHAGPIDEQTPLSAAILGLCTATAFCLLLLNKRLRAKEVVRG